MFGDQEKLLYFKPRSQSVAFTLSVLSFVYWFVRQHIQMEVWFQRQPWWCGLSRQPFEWLTRQATKKLFFFNVFIS